MPDAPAGMTDDEIRGTVREMLLANIHEGASEHFGTPYCFIQPSPTTYPYQYFWDTCLHVFILTALGEHELAKRNVRSLFAMQDDDGFVGHMLFWTRVRPAKWTDVFQSRPSRELLRPHMSALIQPPLVAQAVQRIHAGTQDTEFLATMVPKLKAYFDWLGSHRDFDGDGLISIVSPFESGMDWKPTFDEVVGVPRGVASRRLFWRVVGTDARNFLHRYDLRTLARRRYFLVKEVGFNAIYAQNLQALSQLCGELGDDDGARRYADRSSTVVASMIDKMYDPEACAFYDLYGPADTKIRVLTPTIFFPLVIHELPESITEALIDRHFLHKQEFDTPFPIPSVALSDPSFYPYESDYLWRGPTWVFYNWFVYQCLYYRGFRDEAARGTGHATSPGRGWWSTCSTWKRRRDRGRALSDTGTLWSGTAQHSSHVHRGSPTDQLVKPAGKHGDQTVYGPGAASRTISTTSRSPCPGACRPERQRDRETA